MSVEPPPPDWVRSDTAVHHQRSILDGGGATQTRSSARVVLEPARRVSILDDAERSPRNEWSSNGEASPEPGTYSGTEIVDVIRRAWEEVAFTTLRRNQLVAFLGFVVVLALTLHTWQRGTFSSMAEEISGGRVLADGAPSAPRLSSDQVAWNDQVDDDGRRSTASFASDRAVADERDQEEPASGAKLFVASGKKSSNGARSNIPGDDSSGSAGHTSSRGADSGAGSVEAAGTGSTAPTATETTTASVRYENCAQAAAAGAAPIRLGEPGYRLSLDADKNGVACEKGSTPEDPGDGPVDSLYADPTTTTTSVFGSTTTVSITGAGTTSTSDSTTTSTTSTTESPTTTDYAESSLTTSTSTTSSTTTSTTETTTTTVATTTTTSTTASTTTTVSTTVTTTTTTLVSTSSSSTTSTTEKPSVDPIRFE